MSAFAGYNLDGLWLTVFSSTLLYSIISYNRQYPQATSTDLRSLFYHVYPYGQQLPQVPFSPRGRLHYPREYNL